MVAFREQADPGSPVLLCLKKADEGTPALASRGKTGTVPSTCRFNVYMHVWFELSTQFNYKLVKSCVLWATLS